MRIIFNPIIFKLQTFGGISRLWSQLTNIKTINILNIAKPTGIFKGCNFNICRPSRIIFSKKNSITINSYHTITLGFGKSICICHDLMEERKTDIFGNIFLYKDLIRDAKEIHCVNSSFVHLVDRVETNGKLYYHDVRGGIIKLRKKWDIKYYENKD